MNSIKGITNRLGSLSLKRRPEYKMAYTVISGVEKVRRECLSQDKAGTELSHAM